MRIRSRIGVMRTEYNTDDPHNPKEIATLYDVFDYIGSKKGDTLFFMMIIRQKSKMVFKQEFKNDFYNAMQQYHRKIRKRAEDINPVAKELQKLERMYEVVDIEP